MPAGARLQGQSRLSLLYNPPQDLIWPWQHYTAAESLSLLSRKSHLVCSADRRHADFVTGLNTLRVLWPIGFLLALAGCTSKPPKWWRRRKMKAMYPKNALSISAKKKKRFVNVVGPIVTPPRSNHLELFEELLPPSAVPRAGGRGGCCLPLKRSARVSDSLTLITTPTMLFSWPLIDIHCRWNWSLHLHFQGHILEGKWGPAYIFSP